MAHFILSKTKLLVALRKQAAWKLEPRAIAFASSQALFLAPANDLGVIWLTLTVNPKIIISVRPQFPLLQSVSQSISQSVSESVCLSVCLCLPNTAAK